jgi:DNA-binding MarR family transcriptional regulator
MLNRVVRSELDAQLRQLHGLAVSEFDVLITLFNAPDARLRMSALAERVMLSPAGLTHLVTRLERDGLVRREVDPEDGRKWFAVLTDSGDAMLRAARPTHNAVLRGPSSPAHHLRNDVHCSPSGVASRRRTLDRPDRLDPVLRLILW